ncbi:HTH-type transcriptional repressor YcnK [Oceanobacillus picturae]|uniref:HTH-type transcriptional repressor YcnK n=1 Tax=Oceanobacillus picturae TaxID=171693 RepID=A0A0U9HAU0_9BACI|nr:DeoR family transcriptional regulator [Oceanobacillus picturae]RIU90006.1 DeoR family transcriptional regulator [Oceanobacillus picturae]GAQ19679.1 HTH-type transcriptional repressor YcnK [Oceanobacillus picturae]
MLPLERKKRIRSLIEKERHIKIAELSNRFGVSEMTIHRDLKPLLEEGCIAKTFGGVTWKQDGQEANTKVQGCVFCGRGYSEGLAYRLILSNNRMETACCAHCGLLRHSQMDGEVMQAICSDFLTHTTISAPLSWYVMDTSVHMGCCHPQVLTFEWREYAEKFVKGFGGNVYSFEEAKIVLMQKMNGGQNNCHSQK